jgi:formylmethanofuran dehydrogenase subunit A
VVRPAFDRAVEKDLHDYFDRYLSMSMDHFAFSEAELADQNRFRALVHPTKKGHGS